MLRRFFNRYKTTPIDEQIEAVLNQMDAIGVTSPEYSKMMIYLERLNKIKMEGHSDPVSRDTIFVVIGNLVLVLLIAAYENKHVMTSKGFSQIIRPKLLK